uniref:IS110 family transposase n=2 Tax=Shewanella litoralis TaxID=2282700 RepID=UPI0013588D47
MKITTIGLDISKTIFHMFAVNQAGKLVKKRAIKRADLLSVFARLEPMLIVMEACGGANHWAREFIKLGHQVKLIAPQYVVPYRRKNKNDFNDAEAIAEAAQRPNMTFVPIKSVEQEDIQMVLRMRKRHVKTMVAINNQVRGFLAEYGLCAAKGKTALATRLPEFIDDESNELSAFARESFRELYADFVAAQEKVEFYTKKVTAYTRKNPICKRVQSVIGIGPMTAAEMYAAIGDGKMFHNGR